VVTSFSTLNGCVFVESEDRIIDMVSGQRRVDDARRTLRVAGPATFLRVLQPACRDLAPPMRAMTAAEFAVLADRSGRVRDPGLTCKNPTTPHPQRLPRECKLQRDFTAALGPFHELQLRTLFYPQPGCKPWYQAPPGIAVRSAAAIDPPFIFAAARDDDGNLEDRMGEEGGICLWADLESWSALEAFVWNKESATIPRVGSRAGRGVSGEMLSSLTSLPPEYRQTSSTSTAGRLSAG